MGTDGDDLSCPGSRMDSVGRRDFKLNLDTETFEHELYEPEESQGFWELEE